MKTVKIIAEKFFDLLKEKDTSIWEIFSQMIDGEPKKIIFMDENDQLLFTYEIPETADQLETDRKIFAKEFNEKLAANNDAF